MQVVKMTMYNFTDLDAWLHYKDYEKTFITIEDQKDVIVKKKLECYGLIFTEPPRTSNGKFHFFTFVFYRGAIF